MVRRHCLTENCVQKKKLLSKQLHSNNCLHELKQAQSQRQSNRLQIEYLKGHSQLLDRADLDTTFLTLKNSSPAQREIQEHLEIRFNLCIVLVDFQLFTEKPVFECAFAHPMILFLSHLLKNSVDWVSVICKLAMKWYLMRMCAS